MRKKDLARNLAISLSNCEWSVAAIERQLARRLPRFAQKYSNEIAKALREDFQQPYAAKPNSISRFLSGNPDFARIYRHCKTRDIWPNPDISSPQMRPTPAFQSLDLPNLPTCTDLAEWLLMPSERLAWYTDCHSLAAKAEEVPLNHYFSHLLAKPLGGVRLIEAPKPVLKSLQRKILHGILDLVPTHDAAFGFVPRRSCAQGAARHAGEEMVVCFDIRDFFPMVSAGRIHALFRCLGYPYPVAQELTGLVSTKTPERVLRHIAPDQRDVLRMPHLPQGAPSSPALANLCAFNLDRRCAGFARKLGMNYTRYADDLTFSGDATHRQALLRLVPSILREEGYEPHSGKTRCQSRHGQQRVTGIVVNQHLNVPRVEFDRLKAVLHACKKSDDIRLADPIFRAQLDGKIAWVEQLNPSKGKKLRERFNSALA